MEAPEKERRVKLTPMAIGRCSAAGKRDAKEPLVLTHGTMRVKCSLC